MTPRRTALLVVTLVATASFAACDACQPPPTADAAVSLDAAGADGATADATHPDAARADGRRPDSAAADATVPDATAPDATAQDAARADSEAHDAVPTDAAGADSSREDAADPCASLVCVDANPCTDDLCRPGVGCLFVPHTGPCDDGDGCTSNDLCDQGACRGDAIAGCGGPSCGDGLCSGDESCASCPRDCSPLGVGACAGPCDPTTASPCPSNFVCVPSDGAQPRARAWAEGSGVCGSGCTPPTACDDGGGCVGVNGLVVAGLCAMACTLPGGEECPDGMGCFALASDASQGRCLAGEACDPAQPSPCPCTAVSGLTTPGLCLVGCHVGAADACSAWGSSCQRRSDAALQSGTCVGQADACNPEKALGCAAGVTCRAVGGGALVGTSLLCDPRAGVLVEGEACAVDPMGCEPGLQCVRGVCRAWCHEVGAPCAAGLCVEVGSGLGLAAGTLGLCAPGCGDGACASGESCATCASDCGRCAGWCGDGRCDKAEDCGHCASDCGACTRCGDSHCQSDESCLTCPSDCGGCPLRCGDAVCSPAESCFSCASECGACGQACGDGACTPDEGAATCPVDCAPGTSRCGDGRCDPGEDCAACPDDCKLLGGASCGARCDPTLATPNCGVGEACLPERLGSLDDAAFVMGQGVCGAPCSDDVDCGDGNGCLLLPGVLASGVCGASCDAALPASCALGAVCVAKPGGSGVGVCVAGEPCAAGDLCAGLEPGVCLVGEDPARGACVAACYGGGRGVCPGGQSCVARLGGDLHQGRCVATLPGCDPLAQSGCGSDETCLAVGGVAIGGLTTLCTSAVGLMAEGEPCLYAGERCQPGLVCVDGTCSRYCDPLAPSCGSLTCLDLSLRVSAMAPGAVGLCE